MGGLLLRQIMTSVNRNLILFPFKLIRKQLYLSRTPTTTTLKTPQLIFLLLSHPSSSTIHTPPTQHPPPQKMPPPTPLSIATNSLTRLLKEEASYRTELASQQQRVEKLSSAGDEEEEGGEGNAEFRLRQEVCMFLFFWDLCCLGLGLGVDYWF